MATATTSTTIGLPPLPLRSLKDICSIYLESIIPFCTPSELSCATQLVSDFQKKDGVGEKLQQLMEQRAATTANWLEEWWLQLAYLSYRKPLLWYSNPCNTFSILASCKVIDAGI